MAAKYELDGYTFVSASDFERAKKEKETIAYLQANTDMTDMKAVYKIYKNAVEKVFNNIIDYYITLYQNQNQRILTESINQVEREHRAEILAQTERSLTQLRTRSLSFKENLSGVSSAASYLELKAQLDDLLGSCESSLRTYAAIE